MLANDVHSYFIYTYLHYALKEIMLSGNMLFFHSFSAQLWTNECYPHQKLWKDHPQKFQSLNKEEVKSMKSENIALLLTCPCTFKLKWLHHCRQECVNWWSLLSSSTEATWWDGDINKILIKVTQRCRSSRTCMRQHAERERERECVFVYCCRVHCTSDTLILKKLDFALLQTIPTWKIYLI